MVFCNKQLYIFVETLLGPRAQCDIHIEYGNAHVTSVWLSEIAGNESVESIHIHILFIFGTTIRVSSTSSQYYGDDT